MPMKPLYMILASFFLKIGEMLSTSFGWLLAVCCAIATFFAGSKVAFFGVLICIFLDAISGIWSSKKQGKYTTSELLRDTFSKVFAYLGMLVFLVLMGKMRNYDTTIATDIVAICICATELWSFSGNMLIVNPRLVLFNLIKFALVGEIARKLGVGENDVKEALETNSELITINKSKNNGKV